MRSPQIRNVTTRKTPSRRASVKALESIRSPSALSPQKGVVRNARGLNGFPCKRKRHQDRFLVREFTLVLWVCVFSYSVWSASSQIICGMHVLPCPVELACCNNGCGLSHCRDNENAIVQVNDKTCLIKKLSLWLRQASVWQ